MPRPTHIIIETGDVNSVVAGHTLCTVDGATPGLHCNGQGFYDRVAQGAEVATLWRLQPAWKLKALFLTGCFNVTFGIDNGDPPVDANTLFLGLKTGVFDDTYDRANMVEFQSACIDTADIIYADFEGWAGFFAIDTVVQDALWLCFNDPGTLLTLPSILWPLAGQADWTATAALWFAGDATTRQLQLQALSSWCMTKQAAWIRTCLLEIGMLRSDAMLHWAFIGDWPAYPDGPLDANGWCGGVVAIPNRCGSNWQDYRSSAAGLEAHEQARHSTKYWPFIGAFSTDPADPLIIQRALERVTGNGAHMFAGTITQLEPLSAVIRAWCLPRTPVGNMQTGADIFPATLREIAG